MKINEKLVNDIISRKVKIKNENDKIKLCEYENFIPMYDIYTQQIYSVPKNQLYDKLINFDYRFISPELADKMIRTFKKYKKKWETLKKKDKIELGILLRKISKMLEIIINYYYIHILINTSYKSLYENNNIIQSSIDNLSICRRNSFNSFINYLKPYYTKIELIKFGQNSNVIDRNMKINDLIKEDIHFDICKQIGSNDVLFEEVKDHSITIKNNNSISDVVFYSFIGASILNNFLRTDTTKTLNKFYYDRLNKLTKSLKKTPCLDKDYYIYRFISDDSFLRNKKIGDTFRDNGFMSTTRDPFYSPGLNGTFGLILVKINLKKNIKGLGLFIEHFSLFPKEEEYLLAPFTKLKLISKDSDFKYYHTNEEFEKRISKKYELSFVSLDYSWLNKIKIKEEECQDFDSISSNVSNKIDLFSYANKYNQIKINGLIFNCYLFNSLGSYGKFYYNKVEKGLVLIHFNLDGYPLLVFELGEKLVINYMKQFYYYDEKKELKDKIIIELILKIGKIFNYNTALIFHRYDNFSCFKSKYEDTQEIFLYMNHFNKTLYNYLKYNKKPFESEKNYKDNFKKIDSLVNKPISKEIKEEFERDFNGSSLKELLIHVIEKNFNKYLKLINRLKLDELNYGEFTIKKMKSNTKYDLIVKKDELYNLLYIRQFDRII